MKHEVSNCETYAYVDDTGALAARPAALKEALKVTQDYEQLTGQRLNSVISNCFSSNTASMHRLKFGTSILLRVHSVKIVGVRLELQADASDTQ